MHLQDLREVWMKLLSHYLWLILRSCGSPVKFPVTGKVGSITPILKKTKKGRPGELQASQSHLSAWQDHGADPPGNCARAHGK